MPSTPHTRPANEQRTARLEARLELYAQYAALLGEEMTAAWSTEPAHAGTLTRDLARARAELAERYDELRGWPEDAAPSAPEAFGSVLADAVLEMDQQRLLDQALRARAETLTGARLLAAGDAVNGDPAHGDPESGDPENGDVREGDVPDGVAALGGALVAARSSGVGGVLGGQYPGVAGAGAIGALGVAAEDAAPVGGTRLDVRF